MDSIKRLASLFEKFPGIGPRQAGRFVLYLLRAPSVRQELIAALKELGTSVRQCASCMRFSSSVKNLCTLCESTSRDASLLAIVASEADLDALERSHTYKGHYFVLGGTISLASEKASLLRERELLGGIPARVKEGLKEIILALPANPEGDFTALHVRGALEPYAAEHGFSISNLGRGLSTGSELEYADPDTIKSALAGRTRFS